MNHTQHTAALEIAARLDEFRKQFPHDHPRLLREYAGLHSEKQVESLLSDKEDEIRDEMRGEIEELEARVEELKNTDSE